MKQALIFFLLLICALSSKSLADEVVYSFPEVFNANPVGRLYLQPLSPHEDQVIDGWDMSVNAMQSVEYNRQFHNLTGVMADQAYNEKFPVYQEDVRLLKGSTYTLTVRVSKGFSLKGYRVEAGTVFRNFEDADESGLEIFLLKFHHKQGSNGHIPPKERPFDGPIGENATMIMGKNGEVFLTSIEAYAKLQVLDGALNTREPNLSLKLSVKPPVTSKKFDTFGTSLSVGYSQQVFRQLSLLAGAAITYQDLKPKDFSATNIDVRKWVGEAFVGVAYDPGHTRGFYGTSGLRYATQRVTYTHNPDSASPSLVIHMALNYQTKKGNGEISLYLQEEYPKDSASLALEPDFVVGIELKKKF